MQLSVPRKSTVTIWEIPHSMPKNSVYLFNSITLYSFKDVSPMNAVHILIIFQGDYILEKVKRLVFS